MRTPRQPEINIGAVGHVDHGKTTLVEALSGEYADRHSEEMKRGISIKLGYADAAFYKCPKCSKPECYTTSPVCQKCGEKVEFLRGISFVDSPGHETLMATMLSGVALMDGAVLVIAANEPCPQPQTREHLAALKILNVKKVVTVQNKIDVVSKERALESYEEIDRFLKNNGFEDSPIVPVSAQRRWNLDLLIQVMEEYVPTPKRDLHLNFRMPVARSFDVNKPGIGVDKIKGGVIGGSIERGAISLGDEIELRPGNGEEITTSVSSLVAGWRSVKSVRPGGLVGIGTKLDPSMTKSDGLVGKIAGKPGALPEALSNLTLDVELFSFLVGENEDVRIEPLKPREVLMVTASTTLTVGVVDQVMGSVAEISLKRPVCAEAGQRTALARRVGSRWRLIGYGIIQ